MPCYTRTTSTVEWGAKTNDALLKAALESLEYNVHKVQARDEFIAFHSNDYSINGSYNIATHQMQITGSRNADLAETQAALKRAYSVQVVKAAAARFGWQLQQKGPDQFLASKR